MYCEVRIEKTLSLTNYQNELRSNPSHILKTNKMKKIITKKLVLSLCLAFSLACFTNSAKAQCSAVGNGTSGGIFCLRTDTVNDLLYVGGGFIKSGIDSMNNCGSWNNSAYSSMGMPGAFGTNDTVLCFTMFHGNLYVGGIFLKAGGVTVNGVAMWDGSMWHAVGNGFDVSVHSLAVYNDSLYAGGDFLNSGSTPTSHIAKWNGVQWKQVAGGINDDVDAMYVWNNELYISGDFTQAGGTVNANHICKWNDIAYSALGTGMTYSMGGMLPMVHAMCAYNGSLYAGGMFDQAGGTSMNNLAKWNGSTWSSIGNVGASMGSDIVSSLCVYAGQLYIGGAFSTFGALPVSNIGVWNGATRSTIGSGMNGEIHAMSIYHSTLYIGGIFTNATGTGVNNLASFFTLSGISPITNLDTQISIYPNPAINNITVQSSTELGLIRIYNSLGETVFQTKSKNKQEQIDISNFPSGFYSMQTQTGYRKIIKE